MHRRLARLALATFALWAAPSQAEPPRRVVSMNACTDQLAMLVAGEGQLYSVSYLATDPGSSVLTEQAKRYTVNHGLAEEVFLMQPDLVLAGTYSTRATVGLLRRLGIQVEEFTPEETLDEIRTNLRRMGQVLGREQRAAELIAEFDTSVSSLQREKHAGLSVATYYANSYTSGTGTLVDALITVSGLNNITARYGFTGTARMPLELLVLAEPDLLVGGGFRYTPPALATENYEHPAYRAVADKSEPVAIPTAYTVCGTPFTIKVAEIMQDAARRIEGRGK